MTETPSHRSLRVLHCLRCVHYGLILWRRHGEIVDATGACIEPLISTNGDAEELIRMIESGSDRISDEYKGAVASRFLCKYRQPRGVP